MLSNYQTKNFELKESLHVRTIFLFLCFSQARQLSHPLHSKDLLFEFVLYNNVYLPPNIFYIDQFSQKAHHRTS